MLVSEYIVSFLVEKGIQDVFGYPGGMVTYLMEAMDKNPQMSAHLCYHEQGAALAACGYGMVRGVPGVAYATSGPGATNLLTGIANAYFDSIPTIFITGQVNTYDMKQGNERQRGFQETDIVAMAKPVTKAAIQVKQVEDVPRILAELYALTMDGRKGPVLLDIPMNIQRSELQDIAVPDFCVPFSTSAGAEAEIIVKALKEVRRPLLIAGAGIRQSGALRAFRALVEKWQIPVVTSMVAVDILSRSNELNLGFVGAYGHRWANFATEKADLLLVMGSRMDGRQTGSNKAWFAPNAKIIRVDTDEVELANTVKSKEIALQVDLQKILTELNGISVDFDWSEWRQVCQKMRYSLSGMDCTSENKWVEAISGELPANALVTTDVGQNQVWVAQSFAVKEQQIMFSGGHGTMGFSLPAAIGASIAMGRAPVYAFVGDGGLQMNIQELQTVVREKLPIKILLLNNQSLGMIRHFQEMYFDSNFVQTKPEHGYTVPDFVAVAKAYGLEARTIESMNDFCETLQEPCPTLYDIRCNKDTYVFPKLAIKKPIYDQEPLMDRELLAKMNQL